MRNNFSRMASIVAVTLLLGVSCTQDEKVGEENKSGGIKVEVTTADATDVMCCSAKLNATCSITNAKKEKGVASFYYGTLNNVDSIKVHGIKVTVGFISESTTQSFSKEISELDQSTQYYYVACITIGDNDYFGSIKSFITQELGVEIITDDAMDLTYRSVTLNATCSITNAKNIMGLAGFYYGTHNDMDSIKVRGKKEVVDFCSENTQSFSTEISGLDQSTQYYYVAFMAIGDTEYYGSIKTFTTPKLEVEVIVGDASDVSCNSATLNATCSIANAIKIEGLSGFYYGVLNDLNSIIVNGIKVEVDMITEITTSFSKEISNLNPSTQYYYVAYITIGINDYYGSIQSFTTNDFEYVDLGLSVKWATHNVGATKPEEYGEYYAWGETEPKDNYDWSTYKWCKGSYNTLIKYCYQSKCGNEGFTDTLTVLVPNDDVAHVKWGGSWRMPTKAEQDDLRNKCTWTWYSSGNTEFNGVAGYKVTSNIEGYTDRFIFLPAAGYRSGTDFENVGSYGHYWSSSLGTSLTDFSFSLYFHNNSVNWYYYLGRALGFPVRPVCP